MLHMNMELRPLPKRVMSHIYAFGGGDGGDSPGTIVSQLRLLNDGHYQIIRRNKNAYKITGSEVVQDDLDTSGRNAIFVGVATAAHLMV